MKLAKVKKEIDQLVQNLAERRGTLVIPLLMEPRRSIAPYMISLVYDKLFEASLEGKNGIDVIIHSSGGDADSAYHVAVMLQETCGDKQLTAIIPRYAKSAATLLACGFDSISMDLPSELGPVDPQIEDPSSGMWISNSRRLPPQTVVDNQAGSFL